MSKKYWLVFIISLVVIICTAVILYFSIKKDKREVPIINNKDSVSEVKEKKVEIEYRANFISHGESEKDKNNLAKIFDELLEDNNEPKDIAFFLDDKAGYFYDKKRIYWQSPNTDTYKEVSCNKDNARVLEKENFDILVCEGSKIYIKGVYDYILSGSEPKYLTPYYLSINNKIYFRTDKINENTGSIETNFINIEGEPRVLNVIDNLELPEGYISADGVLYFQGKAYTKINLSSLKKLFNGYYSDGSSYYFIDNNSFGPKYIARVSDIKNLGFSDNRLIPYVQIKGEVFLGDQKLDGAIPSKLKPFDSESYVSGESIISPCISKCSYISDGQSVYFEGRKIKNADARTFKLIGYGHPFGTSLYADQPKYAKDKNRVFFGDKTISGVNSYYFDTIGGGNFHLSFSKDRKNVFFEDKIIGGADYMSFEYIKSDTKNSACVQSLYVKDSKNIYYKNQIVKNADLDTFEIIPAKNGNYAKDAKSFYVNGKIINKDNHVDCN